VHSFQEPHYFRAEIKSLRRQPNFDKKKCLDLFIEDRFKLLKDVLPLMEKKGNLCVFKRGLLSTLAIQQHEGFDLDYLIDRHKDYPKPDLALVLLCDPKVALDRIMKRHAKTCEPISPSEGNLDKLKQQADIYRSLGERLDYIHYVNSNGRKEAVI